MDHTDDIELTEELLERERAQVDAADQAREANLATLMAHGPEWRKAFVDVMSADGKVNFGRVVVKLDNESAYCKGGNRFEAYLEKFCIYHAAEPILANTWKRY